MGLVSRLTDAAPAAALLVPVHAHAVADLEVDHAGAELDDLAGGLVPGHDGQWQPESAVVDVQIGPAHATRVNLDDDLASRRTRIGNRLELPVGVVLGDDRCAHDVLLE